MIKNLSIRNSKNAKKGLIELCQHMKNNSNSLITVGVEIGSFSGDSAKIFSSNFNTIYCVDQWKSNYDPTGIDLASDPNVYDMEEVEQYFDNIVKERKNIIKIKKSSTEAVLSFSDFFFDFVYIDANHNYNSVCEDLELWIPKVKRDGFICGHDYQKRFPGVIQAIHEVIGEPDAKFQDSSWLKKNVI